MTRIDTYRPLTESGKGVRITDRLVTDIPVEEVRALVARYEWIAFEKNPVGSTELLAYLGQFGSLVQNDRRKDGVLAIDGSKKNEVLLGQGFMPLHRDGALMGTNVAMVGIHCLENKDVTGGRTFITDIDSACKEIAPEILDVLRERGIEGRPVDAYYTKPSDVWHHIAGFLDVDGKSYLNVGFPYREGEKASWMMRIPGVDDARFREIFDRLESVMMSEKYCYYHRWTEGDLLLLDNRRTLHGREAFEGQRALANIQVITA